MSTDAISILVTIALFVFGLWMIISIAHGLLYILGWVLVIASVIWLFRLLSSRRT